MAGQLTATKPSRSDEVLDADLQQKITTQVKILVEGELEGPDESLETEYYRELDSIDKQHHTTGNEFMRMKAKRMENRVIRPPLESSRATNHWIPDEFSF